MTPHEKIAAVYAALALLAAGIGWGFHWWVLDVRYWLPFGLRRQAPDYLPGPVSSMPAPGAGEHHDFDVYAFEDWEQLDPDQAADQLIAEWHGHDPECDGSLDAVLICQLCANQESARQSVAGDVWDQWWADIDGLERECMLVHDWLVREERLWAELKAETRELCAA